MASTLKASRGTNTQAAKALAEDDARRIDHLLSSLELVQKDLTSIGQSLGSGAHDLRRDAGRLVRDARRDLVKMRKAVQRDLDRLQKDLMATAKPSASAKAHATPRRTSPKTSRAAHRQTAASSH